MSKKTQPISNDPKMNYFFIIQTMIFSYGGLNIHRMKLRVNKLKLKHWPCQEVSKFGEINCILGNEKEKTLMIAAGVKTLLVSNSKDKQSIIDYQNHHKVILNMSVINNMTIYHYFGDSLIIYAGDIPVHMSSMMPIIGMSQGNYATCCKSMAHEDKHYYFLSNTNKLIKIDLLTLFETEIGYLIDDFCLVDSKSFFVMTCTGYITWLSIDGRESKQKLEITEDRYRCMTATRNSALLSIYDESSSSCTICMYRIDNIEPVCIFKTDKCESKYYIKYLRYLQIKKLEVIIAVRASMFIDILMIDKYNIVMLRDNIRINKDFHDVSTNGIYISNSSQHDYCNMMVYGYKFITNVKIAK